MIFYAFDLLCFLFDIIKNLISCLMCFSDFNVTCIIDLQSLQLSNMSSSKNDNDLRKLSDTAFIILHVIVI